MSSFVSCHFNKVSLLPLMQKGFAATFIVLYGRERERETEREKERIMCLEA
jgi:hypothetical protein